MNEKIVKLGELDTPYILNLMANRWNSEQEKEIRNEFKVNDEDTFVYSDHQHQIITGRALKLAKRVVALGGTDDEVENALKYLHICINMKKYGLDHRKAFDRFGIGKLNEKYIIVFRTKSE